MIALLLATLAQADPIGDGELCVVRRHEVAFDPAPAPVWIDGHAVGALRRRQRLCMPATPGAYLLRVDAVAWAGSGRMARGGPDGRGPLQEVNERVEVPLALGIQVAPGTRSWVTLGREDDGTDLGRPVLVPQNEVDALDSRLDRARTVEPDLTGWPTGVLVPLPSNRQGTEAAVPEPTIDANTFRDEGTHE